MKLTVDLHGLTWHELLSFADAGRAAGCEGAEPVHMVMSDQDDMEPVALELEVEDLQHRIAVVLADDRPNFVLALERVIQQDGDARGVLPELQRLLDQLRS